MARKIGKNKRDRIIKGVNEGTIRWKIAQDVGLPLHEVNRFIQNTRITRGPLSRHRFAIIEEDFKRRKAERELLAEG